MSKKIIISLSLGAFSALVAYLWLKPEINKKPALAILTTLSHPALTAVSDAFKKQFENIDFLEYNAEGSAQSANLIAKQIAQNSRVLGVLAIGTLAAQSITKAEKRLPIVIAAVSDTEIITQDKNNTNICGLTDSINASYQIEKIKNMFPELKKLAILYTPHEANSASMVKMLESQAREQNLDLEIIGVYETQQIASASLRACEKNDALLITLDNQLVASMPAVIKITKNKPCAVITSNESPIHQGASVAFGIDYYKSGEEAAKIMKEILVDKKNPQDMKFIHPQKLEIYVNNLVIKQKNIKFNLSDNMKIINGEHDEK